MVFVEISTRQYIREIKLIWRIQDRVIYIYMGSISSKLGSDMLFESHLLYMQVMILLFQAINLDMSREYAIYMFIF